MDFKTEQEQGGIAQRIASGVPFVGRVFKPVRTLPKLWRRSGEILQASLMTALNVTDGMNIPSGFRVRRLEVTDSGATSTQKHGNDNRPVILIFYF
jgi:hypothetical protein